MSLKKNVIANFVGQGWTAIMGIAFIPLYIKYLGVEAYGLIGFYAVMQAWLILFDMGIAQTLNREMARFAAGTHTSQSIHDLLRSLEILTFILALSISVIVWMSSHYIATRWLNVKQLSLSEVSTAITLIGFVIALRLIEGIYKGSLLGLQKQIAVNVVNIVIATLRFAGVVGVLAWYSSNIKIFFIWQVFTSVISVMLLVYLTYQSLPKFTNLAKFSSNAIKEIWRFASGMMGISFLALLLTQVDKVLLSKLITLEEYGYYTLATSLAGGLALISIPITQAIYPRFVECVAQNKQQELIKLYHQGAQFISCLVAPLALMLAFFGEEIIYLWSANSILAIKTAPILLPLVIGTFLNCLVWMPYQVQLAYGWTGFAIKVNAIAVLVLVPAIFWIAPRYGALGVAWVWALLNAGYITIAMHFMFKRLLKNEKWIWYWNDVFKQIIMACIVMLFIRSIMPDLISDRLIQTIIYIFGLCFAIFLTSLQSSHIKPLTLSILGKIFYKK